MHSLSAYVTATTLKGEPAHVHETGRSGNSAGTIFLQQTIYDQLFSNTNTFVWLRSFCEFPLGTAWYGGLRARTAVVPYASFRISSWYLILS